jgi:hypothetical protein
LSNDACPQPSYASLAARLPTADLLYRHLLAQAQTVVGSVFKAAHASPLALFPLHNTFDLFGLDMLVDNSANVWLLEVPVHHPLQT